MKESMIVIMILSVLSLLYVPPILYFKLGWFKTLYHDLLGWHTPDDSTDSYFDGCSVHDTCKYCHQEIMQDSQGNWFVP